MLPTNLEGALTELREIRTEDGLRNLIDRIANVFTGDSALLFSGKHNETTSYRDVVDDIESVHPNVQSVRSTDVGQFLDLDINRAFELKLLEIFGDNPRAEGTKAHAFLNGTVNPDGKTKVDGMWDMVSKNFAAQISGDVHVLVSPKAEMGIFELSELERVLNNPKVTTIEGIDRAVLVEMAKQTNGIAQVKHALSATSFARVELSGLLSAGDSIDKYLTTSVDDVFAYIESPSNLAAFSKKVGLLGSQALDNLLTGTRNIRAFDALTEVGTIAVQKGIAPHLHKFGAAGVALSALFMASEAEGASSPEEAKAIMERWALDAVGSEVGSIAAAGLATAITAAVAASAVVSVPLIIGASIVGGFLGSEAAEDFHAYLHGRDEAVRRDMLRRLGELYFGEGTTETVDTPPEQDAGFLRVDPTLPPEAMVAAANASLVWRYALAKLNPFVVGQSEAFYDGLHNPDGALDLFDATTGQGLTDQYLLARAKAVHAKAMLIANGETILPGHVYPGGYDDHYLDAGEHSDGPDSPVELNLHYTSDAFEQQLFGGNADDALRGGAVDDMLFGGDGDDIVEGRAGADYLEGGEGRDTYIAGNGDVIFDVDGLGQVTFDDVVLDGGQRAPGASDYEDAGGQFRYTLGGKSLTVTRKADGASVEIKEFKNLDLGISLTDVPVTPEPARGVIIGTSLSESLEGIHEPFGSGLDGFNHDDRIIGNEGRDWIFAWEKPLETIDGIDTNDVAHESLAPDRDLVEGGVGKDVIYGGGGDDRLYATTILDAESVMKGTGSPVFAGLEGDWGDLADGGYGNDELYGSAMLDGLFGGDGNDLIYGGGGDDQLHGDMQVLVRYTLVALVGDDGDYGDYPWISVDSDGSVTTYFFYRYQHVGDDRIFAGDGNDTAFGEAGDDVIFGEAGDDSLSGDASIPAEDEHSESIPGALHGNDTLYGGEGNDGLVGNGGNDRLFGGNGDDLLDGDFRLVLPGDLPFHGEDYLDGGSGSDTLIGDGNGDVLTGGPGDDFLYGDLDGMDAIYHGNDTLYGDAGSDQMVGHGGDDHLFGGDGNDFLYGDDIDLFEVSGDDVLVGGAGVDELSGGLGNDELSGGIGDDSLWGDDGNDRLAGNQGMDYLEGGSGADTYLFAVGDSTVVEGGIEAIVDTAGQGNRIEFASDVDPQALSVTLLGDSGDLILNYSGTDALYVFGGLTGAIESYAFGGSAPAAFSDLLSAYVADAHYLDGVGTDDLVFGSGHDDALHGQGGRDELYGGLGADTLFGDGGGDVLIGGAGDDVLHGGDGSDEYRFAAGHGQDVVDDTSGFDQLHFTDALYNELTFAGGDSDLVISRGDDSVTVRNWTDGAIDQLRFADSSVMAIADVLTIAPSLGAALTETDVSAGVVAGTAGDDDFAVAADGVMLRGGAGDDTYRFSAAFPATVVEDTSGQTTLVIEGDPAAEPYLNLDGDDLVVVLDGSQVARLAGGALNLPSRMVAPSGVSYTGAALSVRINQSPASDVPITALTVDEDTSLSWVVPEDAFIDLDDASLEMSVNLAGGGPLPDWLAFDPATKTLSGVPENRDVGELSLKLSAVDKGGLRAEQLFSVEVVNVNDRPHVIAPIGLVGARAGYAFTLALAEEVFADIDPGDRLTFHARQAEGAELPAWLGLDALTGVLSGIPADGESGLLDLLVTATDRSGASASVPLHINVDSEAGDSVLHSAGLGPVDSLQIFSMESAGDVDGDGFDDILVQTAVEGHSASLAISPDTLPAQSSASYRRPICQPDIRWIRSGMTVD